MLHHRSAETHQRYLRLWRRVVTASQNQDSKAVSGTISTAPNCLVPHLQQSAMFVPQPFPCTIQGTNPNMSETTLTCQMNFQSWVSQTTTEGRCASNHHCKVPQPGMAKLPWQSFESTPALCEESISNTYTIAWADEINSGETNRILYFICLLISKLENTLSILQNSLSDWKRW